MKNDVVVQFHNEIYSERAIRHAVEAFNNQSNHIKWHRLEHHYEVSFCCEEHVNLVIKEFCNYVIGVENLHGGLD